MTTVNTAFPHIFNKNVALRGLQELTAHISVTVDKARHSISP